MGAKIEGDDAKLYLGDVFSGQSRWVQKMWKNGFFEVYVKESGRISVDSFFAWKNKGARRGVKQIRAWIRKNPPKWFHDKDKSKLFTE